VPEQGAAIGADYRDDGMHMSDTIDYDVVIQGKVDIVLDSGELRTLSAGSMVVMGGVNHSWQNRYDEPCLMATITVETASDRG
jgi:quercetin dioxygenase-like cupin family protein